MVTAWRSLGTGTKIFLIVVAILALWAVVGAIPISDGGESGPPVPASAR